MQIGSLEVLNCSLIQKYKWRFYWKNNFLQVRLISKIYGITDGMPFSISTILGKSVWLRIVASINIVHDKNIIPLSSLYKKLGDRRSTKCWSNIWVGLVPLGIWFHRLFLLDSCLKCLISDRQDAGWKWEWSWSIRGGALQSQIGDLVHLIDNV